MLKEQLHWRSDKVWPARWLHVCSTHYVGGFACAAWDICQIFRQHAAGAINGVDQNACMERYEFVSTIFEAHIELGLLAGAAVNDDALETGLEQGCYASR